MQRIEITGTTQLANLERVELTAPGIARTATTGGSGPTDITGIAAQFGTSARHVFVHDVHDLEWWAGAQGVVQEWRLYDVTAANIGWQSLAPGDRTSEAGGHGHALYTQNYATSGTRVIDTCVFVAGFSLPGKIYGTNRDISPTGWQLEYGEDGKLRGVPADPNLPRPWNWESPRNKLANYDVKHSIFVGKRFIVGNEGKSAYGAHNISFEGCAFASCRLQFGYDGLNGYGTLRNNVFTKGLIIGCSRPAAAEPHAVSGKLASWERLTVVDNIIVVPKGETIHVDLPGPNDPERGWQWDSNTYYSQEARPFEVTTQGEPNSMGFLTYKTERLSFAEWKARTGFDANSTFVSALPERPIVRVFAVEGLDVDAANVFIYNSVRWPNVERPEGWRGADVTARDVRRWAEPLPAGETFTMAGEPTPPAGYTAPVGKPTPILGTLFPEIGVFRVEKPKAIVDDDTEAEQEVAKLSALLAAARAQLTQAERVVAAAKAERDQAVAERDALARALAVLNDRLKAARAKWAELGELLDD